MYFLGESASHRSDEADPNRRPVTHLPNSEPVFGLALFPRDSGKDDLIRTTCPFLKDTINFPPFTSENRADQTSGPKYHLKCM